MKKTLCIVLALLFALSCMGAALAEDKVTITMIQRLPAAYIVEDNPVIAAWGDRTGVNIEVEAPPISNYSDRLNVVMASDDLPDLIYVQNLNNTYQQWARDGLLLDLTDYLTPEIMPNACKVLTQDELAGCLVDGRLYSLPRVQTKPLDCITYRGDWLEKLGLEVPKTAQEFADVMLAFAKQDPDGNGIDDTYGFSIRNFNDRNLIHAFGLRPSDVPDENGEYIVMEGQAGYMAYLTWLRDMYLNGALDPEWYLTQSYEDQDKFFAGKIGALYTDIIINHVTQWAANATFVAVNPEGTVVAGPSLLPDGADQVGVYYAPQVWGAYAINADSEHIEETLRVLDDGYTDECVTLLFKGIEGLTYTSLDPETRVITLTPEQTALAEQWCASYATINYQLSNKDMIIAGGTSTNEIELANWMAANDFVSSLEYRISYLGEGAIPGYNDESTRLTNDGVYSERNEKITQYICGQITEEEMASYLQNVYVPACEPMMNVIRASGINQ